MCIIVLVCVCVACFIVNCYYLFDQLLTVFKLVVHKFKQEAPKLVASRATMEVASVAYAWFGPVVDAVVR